MKFIEAPQGSEGWYSARCGLITASMFSVACKEVGGLSEQQAKYVAAVRSGDAEKQAAADAGYKAVPRSELIARAIAGEKTTDFSDEAKRYAADLAIERISGKPHGEPIKAWVLERGHKIEIEARMNYEAHTGAFVTEAGICVSDEGIFGYSTDGLVDDDGLIEIKGPIDSAKIMAMWRTSDVSEYLHQMMGGKWITGRKWCDFIMFVPDLAPVGKQMFVKRIFRDESFIDNMVGRLSLFDSLVSGYESVLRSDEQ